MAVEDQGGTIVFLANPASYGLALPVERMETHISIIFLVGDRVYKLKKALKLPYVDFSTAAIREDACRKEVALNSETAPGLYIGVRRITRSDAGTLEFDGSGSLVDAVVEMSRFEQNQLFDQMAAAGQLTPELMTQTAREIAFYHRRAPVVSKGGGAANIEAVLDINDAGFATSHVFGRAELARGSESFRSRLVQHGELLDRRALAGKVRRCHGDLHLRNICLLGGKPCLFDCIEFNLGIATVDVLYDLAFLLMDLWHRGFPDLANLAMNRYLDETDDEDGFCLLPFLMAIRASVRAHVTATQAEEPGQDAAGLVQEARSYFDLAHAHDCGSSGSEGRCASRRQDHAYQPDVSEKVYREMTRHAELILAQGGSVVADAVFDDSINRRLIEDAAVRTGAGFRGVWLEADPELLWQRVRERAGGPSDATTDVLSGQLTRKPADITWRKLNASRAPDAISDAILRD